MLEVDVARPAVEYFKSQGYEVYTEVQALQGRADLVAVKGEEVVVVEAKAKFCFTVIAQAARWTSMASKIYILTPPFKRTKLTSDEWRLMREVMRWKGIGWLSLQHGGHLHRQHEAKLQDKAKPELLKSYLVPEQQSGPEAGSRGGGYHTDYRGTCNKIAAYVRENPGALLSDVVKKVEHHYKSMRSAQQSLAKCAEKGVIHGVRAERKGTNIVLFPDLRTSSERLSDAIAVGKEELGLTSWG